MNDLDTPIGHAPAMPRRALEPGFGAYCRIGKLELALFHAEDGIYALDDRCPHAGSSLSRGHFDGRRVVCPSHGWIFDVRSGRALSDLGTATRCHKVRVVDDTIFVQVAPFRAALGAALGWLRRVGGRRRGSEGRT